MGKEAGCALYLVQTLLSSLISLPITSLQYLQRRQSSEELRCTSELLAAANCSPSPLSHLISHVCTYEETCIQQCNG